VSQKYSDSTVNIEHGSIMQYRMHSVRTMRPITTDGVAWSVCLCVCWSRSWAPQKGWTDL